MKKMILFALFLLSTCFSYAGNKELAESEDLAESETGTNVTPKHKVYLSAEEEISASFRQHGMQPNFSFSTLSIEPVDKLTFGVSYIGFLGLYKKADSKTYYTSQGLGCCVEYTFFKAKQGNTFWNKGESVGIRARYGHSIGGCDMKFNMYDIGAVYRNHIGVLRLSLSLGYRFIDSKTAGVCNNNNVYLGFGINI